MKEFDVDMLLVVAGRNQAPCRCEDEIIWAHGTHMQQLAAGWVL